MDTEFFQIPERAFAAFEHQTGLTVVLHDLTAKLWPFLSPHRLRHSSPCCARVKATHDWACMDFEVVRLRNEMLTEPQGRYHVCHAGFLEWVVPCLLHDQLVWILFAGQKRPAGSFRQLAHDVRRTPGLLPAPTSLAEVDETQAEFLLELLRQLQARLLQWHQQAAELFSTPQGREMQAPFRSPSRKLQIQRFIHEHAASTAPVEKLARELHLSEGRTMHLVKELFGRSYVDLLNQRRLRAAAALLRNTSLSITEVCLNSGFQDLSHFHRVFRKEFGATPLQYRKQPHA